MQYNNIQHSSNTRTTVTIVLSIIFGGSIIPTTALGGIYFTLENADVPTLYQEVKVKIQRDSATPDVPSDFKFEATDVFFFINVPWKDPPPTCTPDPPSSVTLWKVTVPSDKSYAEATVIIKEAEFQPVQRYTICYKSNAAGESSKVYKASYKSNRPRQIQDFKIPSKNMYTKHKMTPATVYARQENVILDITEEYQLTVHREEGIAGSPERPYLIPCPTASCSKDDIAALCSKQYKDSPLKTGEVSGFGSLTLRTTFTAPANPTTSYRICVPYYFKAGSRGTLMSWALVNSEPITFQPANPSVYTLKPTSPHAGTWNKIAFTGTGLSDKDKIRIVAQGQPCSSTAELLPNIEYTEVRETGGSDTSSVFQFRLKSVLEATNAVTVQVCYSLEGTPNTWRAVYQTADGNAGGDLVISPLQPTGFTVSPATPEIGRVLTVTFTGSGLDKGDTSYLLKCTPEAKNQLEQPSLQLSTGISTREIKPSTGISSDYCDDIETTAKTKYVCTIAKDGSGNANCNVNINPDISNGEGMQLCACYKKKHDTDYALVAGSVTVYPKSPTYTITPYPFYVGQEAKLIFSGTGLSATDGVKIIPKGGDCNTVGGILRGIYMGNHIVKGKEEVTYTIMGTKSVCFTVCYRRGAVWTVSSNAANRLIDSSCPSASSFISDMKLRYTLSLQKPSMQQAVTVTFQGDSSYSVSSFVIIPITEVCTTILCEGVAPCERRPQSGDTYKVTSATSGVFIATLPSSYLICTKAQADLPWVPIRNANPIGSRHYTFDVGDRENTESNPKENKVDTTGKKPPTGKLPKVSITVPPKPDGNNSTILSATAISSTIPAVLITSVVFLYLYNW